MKEQLKLTKNKPKLYIFKNICIHLFVLGVFEKISKSFVMSSRKNWAPCKMDINLIWHLSSFRKSVEKIQVPLKSDKNNGYFIWRQMYTSDHLSLSESDNEQCFGQQMWRI